MTHAQPDQKLEQVVHRIDPQGKLLHVWPLTGGVSAQVMALEIERRGGQTQKMILRRHGAVDLKHNPHIAAAEFRLLQMLQSAGLAVPMPYHLDESGGIFPTPYLVLEYIEGMPEFSPIDLAEFSHQLAAHLAGIHRIDDSSLDLSFLPRQDERCARTLRERPANLDDSIDEGRIRETLESAGSLPAVNEPVLLHGDFWPGNLLWKDGQLAAIIDWEDAALGDPLADLGNSRLEILWAFGVEAMQHFTRQYQFLMTHVDFTNLPYWDLFAALRPAFQIGEWAGDEARERIMRARHRWFITQAFDRLSLSR